MVEWGVQLQGASKELVLLKWAWRAAMSGLARRTEARRAAMSGLARRTAMSAVSGLTRRTGAWVHAHETAQKNWLGVLGKVCSSHGSLHGCKGWASQAAGQPASQQATQLVSQPPSTAVPSPPRNQSFDFN
eukprot:307724-Chlamydomonas_euryale.AAC.6